MLKEMSNRVKLELEDKSMMGSGEVERSKSCWYLEKLLNVLNVQEKLLDNRIGCTFQKNENYADIMNQMDKLESMIKEIEEKCRSV